MSAFYQTNNGTLIISRFKLVPMDDTINTLEEVQKLVSEYGDKSGCIFVNNDVAVDFDTCNFKVLPLANMRKYYI